MKLKLDAEGRAVLSDGKPVYVHDDGKEVAHDAAQAIAKISALNREAQSHRERAETAEASLKRFDGISDPAAAKKALETLANMDAKKLVDAGEVERLKADIAKSYETKISEIETAKQALERDFWNEKIGGAFARSKFITEKVAVPSDLIQNAFGQRFKLESGKVVAYDQSGQRIMSRANPGDFADFEEAIETLISAYPHKDAILRGSNAQGPNARPDAMNGSNAGAKAISRAAFDAMSQADRMNAVKQGATVTD